MKICPECAFANEERFPACLWCNTVLTDVKSTPSPDPNHPEHFQRQLLRQRQTRWRTQLVLAALCYAVVATLLMVIPGAVFNVKILLGFFAAATVVGFVISSGSFHSFALMFLQGAISLAFLLSFQRVGVFAFFMLLGHIVLPAIWHVWVEMIDSGHG